MTAARTRDRGRRLPLRRRWAAGAAVTALGIAALAGSWELGQSSRPAPGPAASSTGLVRVVRTDLVTSQPVGGVIGYGAVNTLVAAGGGGAQALEQAQAAVDTGTQRLSADRGAAADQSRVNARGAALTQATLGADQATLGADQQARQADQRRQQRDCAASPGGQVCAADADTVQADDARVVQDQSRVRVDLASAASAQAVARQKLDQAGAQVEADQVALDAARQALQSVRSTTSTGRIYTGLPAVGTTVSQGQALYSVDGHAVPLLYGAVPMYRMLTAGCSGPDVRQLEEDLVQLGFASSSDLRVDGSFTPADVAAVSRWQASLGVPRTGEVALGDVVFLPGAQRVAGVHVSAGAPVQGGQPVLDLTATVRVVTLQLNPNLAFTVKPGDPVSVDLPDGRTRTPGVVSDVSPVAQATGGGGQTQNGAPQTSVPVIVTLSDPAQVPALDQAPVTVEITLQSARNVLAVPVNALLALQGGGYAVEVPLANGTGTRLLPVRTGIFDNSLVEVSGPGLGPGTSVVVPR